MDDLSENLTGLGDTVREKRFLDAVTYHQTIIDLRKASSSQRPFSIAEKLEANLRQAILLLKCDIVQDDNRLMLPPDIDELSSAGVSGKAWGLFCAAVGALYMKSTNQDDLAKAIKYLNLALEELVKLKPTPVQHLSTIAQRLVDLYDFTRDAPRADSLLLWLQKTTGSDTFSTIATGRISRAMDWCSEQGFGGQPFDFKDRTKQISALEHAIRQDNLEHLDTMLIFTKQTRPSSTLASQLLLTAADRRNVRMAEFLCNHDVTVDVTDENDKTVLHRCQHCPGLGKRGGPEIASFFLSKNDDPNFLNRQDRSGKTALYMACEEGYVDMAAFLLDNGARADLTEMNGKSPLYMACERGDRHIVKCLLDKAHHLDPNAKGPGGLTPLIIAVKFAANHAGGITMVEQLLAKGADPMVEANNKKNALSYIGGVWRNELKRALKNKGAENTMITSPSTVPISGLSRDSGNLTSSRPGSIRSFKIGQLLPSRVSSAAPSFLSMNRSNLSITRSTYSKDSGYYTESRRSSIAGMSMIENKPGPAWSEDGSNDTDAGQGRLPARNDGIDPSSGFGQTPSDPTTGEPGSTGDLRQNPSPLNQDTGSGRNNLGSRRETGVESNARGGSASLDSDLSTHPIPNDDRAGTSNRHSTDSEFDTPSESSEDDYSSDDDGVIPSMARLNLGSSSTGYTEHPAGTPPQSNEATGGRSSMPTPPAERSQRNGAKKRRRGSFDENSGSGDVLIGISSPEDEQKRKPIFACPFAKKDPVAYEHCHRHDYEFKEIKHVKQHLKRRHLVVHCPRCREGFQSEKSCYDHIRQGNCQMSTRQPPEGMTPEQQAALGKRSNSRLTLEEQWFAIWDILFPGLPRPASPYQDEFVNLTEHNNLLREFVETHVPTLVQHEMNELGQSTHASYEEVVYITRRVMMRFINGLHDSNAPNAQHSSPSSHSGEGDSSAISPHETVEIPNPLGGQASGNVMQSYGSTNPYQSHEVHGLPVTSAGHYQHHQLHAIDEGSSHSSGHRQGSLGSTVHDFEIIPESGRPGPSVIPLETHDSFGGSPLSNPPRMPVPDPMSHNLNGIGAEWAVVGGLPDQLLATSNFYNPEPILFDRMFANTADFDPAVAFMGNSQYPPPHFLHGGQRPSPPN